MSLLTSLQQSLSRLAQRILSGKQAVDTDQALQRLKFIEYMVDKSPDIVFWVNAQTARVTYVDETALDLLGFDEQTVLSMSIQQIDPATDNWQGLLIRLADNSVLTRESSFISQDGSVIPIEATYFVVDFGGRQTLVISARDIRERKAMETQIQQQLTDIQNSRRATANMLLDLTQAKQALEQSHQRVKDSIEYAALIQRALMPDEALFEQAFSDYFTLWLPKDVVGGDVFFFTHLRQQDAWLLMLVDCTGHGVPGAFVTMLVKAIEQQVITNAQLSQETVSPAAILSVFNRSIKFLLKQDNKESINNAGFDGAVIYYQPQKQLLSFAGANIPLHHIHNGQVRILKGDRQSIGYKNSDANYDFTEHHLSALPNDCFYLSTDGFIDQNGGEKGFPLGKTLFAQYLQSNRQQPMSMQKEALLAALSRYQGDELRNDDVSVIGFRI
jgi:PAS domain S-box-containing protein